MSALSDSIVARLQDAGVGAVFGVPGGGGNLDLIESAGRAGLRFVLTSTETGAALAALGQAEVTGRPGACLATLGPGAASLVNGVACAYLDRAAVLVFTDRHPLAARDRYTHQHLDQRALFLPITKWSGTLSADALETAMRVVLDAPPGPVHIECPDDADPVPTGDHAAPPAATPTPAPDWRAALHAAVSTARKPLVIAGLGARRTEDAAAIRALCATRGIPAMVTYKAKGVVPDDHPGFAGVFTNASIERPLVEASDLIIGLGLDPVELLPRPWPYRQPVIYVGSWPVATGHVPFGLQCITAVGEAVGTIDRALPASAWNVDDIGRDRARQRHLIDIPADGLTAQRVVEIAAARLAATHRVTVDAGAHMVPATMIWPVAEPNGMLISNGLSTMGFALPAAIGAAVADPDRPVVALTGDGGLLMCAAELLTASREQLPIITIVLNDASLSLIEIKQQQKRYPAAGVALGPVDWTSLSRGFGVAPFLARDEPELVGAIEQAAGRRGPSLIEARIDRSSYARTFQAVRG
ncbi:MAG TPA: thiamine pyrophosphate-binding protein [Vicinamibacterales bacterium]|nr:thiamine pyrophosphate-binding protein [Vicinamibacterales bacterium]